MNTETTTPTAPTVAETILSQLGGRRFIVMTGARDFVGRDDGLSFRLPGNSQDGANAVRITLTAADDYTIETLSVRRVKGTLKATPKSRRDGIYCDALQSTFTVLTGLHTRL